MHKRRALRQRHFLLAPEPSHVCRARPPPLEPAGPASPGESGTESFPSPVVGAGVGERSLRADRERLRPEPRHPVRGARGHHPPLTRPPARAHRLGSAPRSGRHTRPNGIAGKSGGLSPPPLELPFLSPQPWRARRAKGAAAAWGRPGRSPGGTGPGSRALTLSSGRPTASRSLARLLRTDREPEVTAA